ncbi:MAG: hypothetical protein COS27_08945 [Nitrospirae bacterium CG02_land_8_20_14_3_00_41_53]|nr:MAG: hypothetical protein COS27_08945 [Nitrospirae bacterium CG02_land_8_20_14_3_00_41_53]
MKLPVTTFEKIGDFKNVIESMSIEAQSPTEFLAALERIGIGSYVTEEGHLMIRYWQIGAEDFVPPEQASIIRTSRPLPDQGDNMDWLSKNLQTIRQEYGGKWVAVYNERIVASSSTLPDLMNQIEEYDRPLITLIPAGPVIWTFTYAL